MLNNRELASAIIICLFVVGVCSIRDVRTSVVPVLRAAFVPRLMAIWIAFAAAVTGVTHLLHRVGLGYPGSVKDAVVWGVVVGLPLLFAWDSFGKDRDAFRRAIRKVVGATVFVEFFVNLYVFALWVELVLQVVVIVVGLMSIVSEQDPKTKPVAKVMNGLTSVIGLAVMASVAIHLVRHYDDVDVRPTALSFLQPVTLAVAILCLSYVVALMAWYGLAFMRIGWGQPSRRHRWRAKAALLVTLHIDARRIYGFSGTLPRRLARTATWRSARDLVRRYKDGAIHPLEPEM